jgi:hypothetical protein
MLHHTLRECSAVEPDMRTIEFSRDSGIVFRNQLEFHVDEVGTVGCWRSWAGFRKRLLPTLLPSHVSPGEQARHEAWSGRKVALCGGALAGRPSRPGSKTRLSLAKTAGRELVQNTRHEGLIRYTFLTRSRLDIR